MRNVLAPYIKRQEPRHSFLEIEVGDGTADVYLDDDGMMANHITGQDPWDLLVTGAAVAGWVVLPVGAQRASRTRIRSTTYLMSFGRVP